MKQQFDEEAREYLQALSPRPESFFFGSRRSSPDEGRLREVTEEEGVQGNSEEDPNKEVLLLVLIQLRKRLRRSCRTMIHSLFHLLLGLSPLGWLRRMTKSFLHRYIMWGLPDRSVPSNSP
jgi:hypothetical protein